MIKYSLRDQNPLDLGDAGLEVLRGHLHLGPGGLDRLLDGRDVGVDLTARPDHAQGLDLKYVSIEFCPDPFHLSGRIEAN